ncbi:hypothetical protein Tco_1226688 [Tanacetum coccineum]
MKKKSVKDSEGKDGGIWGELDSEIDKGRIGQAIGGLEEIGVKDKSSKFLVCEDKDRQRWERQVKLFAGVVASDSEGENVVQDIWWGQGGTIREGMLNKTLGWERCVGVALGDIGGCRRRGCNSECEVLEGSTLLLMVEFIRIYLFDGVGHVGRGEGVIGGYVQERSDMVLEGGVTRGLCHSVMRNRLSSSEDYGTELEMIKVDTANVQTLYTSTLAQCSGISHGEVVLILGYDYVLSSNKFCDDI